MKQRNPSEAAGAHRRLAALVALVPPGSVVADIGTDQGLLARWLVSSGRASRCIATERDPERLARAFGLPAAHPWSSRLELRAGSGLEPLHRSDGVDVLVLAGLGGATIRRILSPERLASLGVRRLVLDPRSELGRVRACVSELGFGIVDETVIRERERFFTVMAAESAVAGARAPLGLRAQDVLEAGPVLLSRRDPLAREYWSAELLRLQGILATARSGPGRAAALVRRATAARVLSALEPET